MLDAETRASVFQTALDQVKDCIRIRQSTGSDSGNQGNEVIYANPAWQTKKKGEAECNSASVEHIDLGEGFLMDIEREPSDESMLHDIFDLMPHIIWCQDNMGKVEYFNKVFVDYSGLNVQEASGDSWRDLNFIHPDDLEHAIGALLHSLQTQEMFEIECRLRRYDGDYRWVVARSVPVYNRDGTFKKWFGTCTDIDNSKKTEENLRQAKANLHAERRLLDTTLNQLPVGILFARAPSGELFYSNSLVEKVWRQPMIEAETIEDYAKWKGFHKDGRPYTASDWPIARSLKNGERVVKEDTVVEFPDGIRGIMRLSSSPVYDDNGDMVTAVMVCEDVTERVKMEELRTELMAREQAALEASRLKSEFLRNVSHELRTPMNHVLGMTDALMDDMKLTKEQRSCVDTIRESGKLLLLVLNDILDFSKVEAGKMELESTNFDLAHLFHHVDVMTQPTAKGKNIVLTTELANNLTKFLIGDPGRLQQILMNLVSNAVKFTNQGSVYVKVCGNRIGDKLFNLVFTVEDTGIGIPDQAMSRLFQPFMQADSSTTRRFGGSGLGLSICKSLVTLMKGDITVESELGQGTKFTVAVTLRVGSEPSEPQKRKKPSLSFANAKFLVVEDNIVNQKLAVRVLKRLGATHVDVAANGAEALVHFEKQSYEVILMDCQMPVMDGYEATRRIRQLESSRQSTRTPIVAVTAGALKVDRDACFDAGMDAHVAKPFTQEDLQEALRLFI